MTDKAQAMINELVAAAIAFGRGQLPDWQTRIEDAKRELREYIDELEEKQRWIPVSEKPKVDGRYLLRNIYDDIYPAKFVAESESWMLGRYDSITHWMPLPEPPEVQA